MIRRVSAARCDTHVAQLRGYAATCASRLCRTQDLNRSHGIVRSAPPVLQGRLRGKTIRLCFPCFQESVRHRLTSLITVSYDGCYIRYEVRVLGIRKYATCSPDSDTLRLHRVRFQRLTASSRSSATCRYSRNLLGETVRCSLGLCQEPTRLPAGAVIARICRRRADTLRGSR